MLQVLRLLAPLGLGIVPLCVRSHKKFVVTIACAVAAGAFVAGAVALLVMLPVAPVVVNEDVPVHVVAVLIGMVERGAAQLKLTWAVGAPAPMKYHDLQCRSTYSVTKSHVFDVFLN